MGILTVNVILCKILYKVKCTCKDILVDEIVDLTIGRHCSCTIKINKNKNYFFC